MIKFDFVGLHYWLLNATKKEMVSDVGHNVVISSFFLIGLDYLFFLHLFIIFFF